MKRCACFFSLLVFVGANGTMAQTAAKLEPMEPTTGRIGGPPVDKWTPEQKAAWKDISTGTTAPSGQPWGSTYVLLNHPDMVKAYIKYNETVRGKASFRRGIRELIIILSARKWNRNANWGTHAPMALNDGKISQKTVEDIKRGVRPQFDNEDEQAAYDFYTELTSNQAVSDKTYRNAWRIFGTEGLLDLTLLIGLYESSGMLGAAHRIELRPGTPPQLPVLLFQRGEEPVTKASN